MKRIYFILPNLKVGGGNRVFVELANRLIEKGYFVEITYPANSKDTITFYISPKIHLKKVGSFKKSKIGKLWNILLLLYYVFKNRKDSSIILSDPLICILFLFHPSKNLYRFIQADDYAIFNDRKIIKSYALLRVYKKLTRISYRKKIKYIFNSNFVYQKFILLSGRMDVPYSLVHPAINHQVFADFGVRDWDTKITIGLVARRHPWKGFSDFIAAWKILKDQLSDKVGNVYIISHDDLSEFETKDFTLITPASDSDISLYLNKIHLFISTSWWEGFGLPPLEAMACGCACIISKSGGVFEYAKEGENSIMYTPKDVNELATLILKSIDKKVFLKRLGENGKINSQKFTWENSAFDFIDCLNQN